MDARNFTSWARSEASSTDAVNSATAPPPDMRSLGMNRREVFFSISLPAYDLYTTSSFESSTCVLTTTPSNLPP